MKRVKVVIRLEEEMLGTKAANKDVFADFIASKAPDGDKRKEELENCEHREEQGTTVFHAKDGKGGIYDYQIKGFFKEACGALRQVPGSESSAVKAYKSKIDSLVFVYPRFIKFAMPEGSEYGICERPLRCETMQGPRVSVARSETAPANTEIAFEVECLVDAHVKLVREWLEYGQRKGLGCWRNSGKGRFSVVGFETVA